ncbi:MAG: hypothetical protein VXW32_05875 [Myxococcota bacterium]|nr:hypothetical protein [Myxococcota bacterium]
MIWVLWAAGLAQAVPTRLVATVELDAGVERFSQGQHETMVAFLDSLGGLNVLDTRTWSVDSVTPSCSVKDLALHEIGEQLVLYGACDSGDLVAFGISDTGELGVGPGDNLSLDSDDGLVGLVSTSTGIWAAADQDVGVGLHDYDPETDSAHVYGPYTTGLSGFKGLAVQGESLVVMHGSDDVTKVAVSSGGAIRNEENLTGRNFESLASDGDNLLYLMDKGGAVVRFMTSSNEYQVVLNESDDLETLSALAMLSAGETPYLALFEDTVGELRLYPFSQENMLSDQVEQIFESEEDLMALHASEQALFAGGSFLGLEVYRSGPWVALTEVTTELLGAGDAFEVGFESDQEGTYSLRLGSDTGELLASGSVDAESAAVLSVQVDAQYAEGVNRLWLEVQNNEGTGHDSVVVRVDNPPSVVPFTEEHVGFGDSEIVLHFEGIPDEDLAGYQVFFSTEEFTNTNLPESSIEVDAEPGEWVTVSIPDLINGQLYFVGIRARDSGGKEGDLSEVLSIIPEPAVGASALAGEQGGCTGLSTTATNRLITGAIPFMLVALFHRRKKSTC